MSDKFTITAELEVRLSQQVDRTIESFRKKVGKVDLQMKIDKQSFDADSKYILASYKEIIKAVKKNPLKVSIDRTHIDSDSKYILASFKHSKTGIEKSHIKASFSRSSIDDDIKYVLSSFRHSKQGIEKQQINARFNRANIDDDVKYLLSSFRLAKNGIESKQINTKFNRTLIDSDVKYILSSARTMLASLSGRSASVRINADIDPSFQQFQQTLAALSSATISISLPTRTASIAKFATLATNINSLSNAINALNLARLTRMSNTIATLSQGLGSLSNLSRRAYNFNFAFNNANVLGQLVTAIDSIRTAFMRASIAGINFRNVLNDIHQSIQNIGRSRVAFGLGGVRAQVAAQNNLRNAVRETAGSIEDLGRQTAETFRRFGAYTLATAGFFQLSYAIRNAVKEFIEYEAELTKVRQVTGQSITTTEALSRQIGNLATSYGVSSSKILNVSLVLAQAGFTAKEVGEALEALTKTELAATFDNIEKTVEGAIAGMAQFNYETSQLDEVLSSVNTVSAKFAVESEDIITAIQKTGGAFAAAGGSINELQALFTSVRATTRESADTIATGFRTIFTRLQRVRTQEFLRGFGINLNYTADQAKKFGKTAGEFVGPYQAIQKLNAALKQLSTSDPRFAQITEELGGFRQISKVIPLVTQYQKAQEVLSVAQRSNNSLTEDAVIAQQSFANQLTKVREEFLLMIRDIAGDKEIKEIVSIFINLAESLIDVIRYTKEAIPLFATLAATSAAPIALRFLNGARGIPTNNERGLSRNVNQNQQARSANNLNLAGIGAGLALTGAAPSFFDSYNDKGIKDFGDGLQSVTGSLISAAIQIRLFSLGLQSSRDFLNGISRSLTGGARARSLNDTIRTSENFNTQNNALRDLENRHNLRPRDRIRYANRVSAETNNLQSINNTRGVLNQTINSPTSTQSQRAAARNALQGLRQREARSRLILNNASLNLNNYDQAAEEIRVQQGRTGQANVERTNARNRLRRRSRNERYFRRVAPINAGIAIGGGIIGQIGSDISRSQLDSIALGNGGNKNLAKAAGVGGGVVQSGSIGAAIGGQIGAIFGPEVAILGRVVGGLTGAVYGFVNATEEFRKAMALIEVKDISDNLDKRLKEFSTGKISSESVSPLISSDLLKLRDKLQSESGNEIRQDIKAALDNSAVGITALINSLAEGSYSIEEFNSKINDTTFNFAASVIGIPIAELKRQVITQIQASNEAKAFADTISSSRQEYESQIRALTNLRNAFSYAESKAKNLGDTFNSFLSGSGGSAQQRNSISKVQSIDRIPDASRFAQDIKSFTSQFGIAGKEIGNLITGASQAASILPDILLDLKSVGSFGSENDLSNTFEDRLDVAGISGSIKKVIQSKLPVVFGQDFRDSEFFRKIDEDLLGVVKTLTSGFDEYFSILVESANKSSDALKTFSSGLDSIKTSSLASIFDRASLEDFTSKLIESRDTFDSKTPNFTALLASEDRKRNIITNGASVGQLAGQRLASRNNILSLQEQLNNTENITQQRNLIELRSNEALQLEKTTQALKHLAENTSKLTILQNKLNLLQTNRLKNKDFATDAVFGDRASVRRQQRVLSSAQIAANTGNINVIQDDLKQEVLALFRAFGETLLPGTQISGNQAINKNLINAGVNPNIVNPGKDEKSLQTLIEEEIKNSAAAQTALNTILSDDRIAFSKNIHQELTEFISNLDKTLNKSFANELNNKITGAETDLQAKSKDLNFINSVGGTSALANIDAIVSIEKEMKNLVNTPETLQRNLDNLNKKEAINLISTSKRTGFNTLSSTFDQANDFYDNVTKNLPDEIVNKIWQRLLQTDVGRNSLDKTVNTRKFYQAVRSELEKEQVVTSGARTSLQEQRRTVIENVGGTNNYVKLAEKATRIQTAAANLQSRDTQELTRQISQLTKNIEQLRQQRAALGFASGGIVPGTGNSDSISARLTPGEGIITKGAMQKYGPGIVHSINKGTFPKNYANGGVVAQNGITIDSDSLTRFNMIVQNLSNQVDRLQSAFNSMPTEITMTGRHTVEIIVNGAQVLTSLYPEISKLIEYGAKDAINKMLKNKFPNVGSYNG